MNVLSLFDGCAMARVALERAGIPVDKYYASEIDRYAIKIAQKNYPDIIQLGDVRSLSDLSPVDLIIGGSPCQDLSFAGKGKGLDGERSSLFFEYVRLLQILKPKYFVLENVRMKKYYENVFSFYVGVFPVVINSSLVSAQDRKRLYWTNIPNIEQPEDKGIEFKDIMEHNADVKYYYSDKGVDLVLYWGTQREIIVYPHVNKARTLEATMYKNYSKQRLWAVEDVYGWRYLTPLECERLQTLPDGYTEGVSDTQRYKMLGNGFTVDVIAHILSYIGD